MRNRLQQKAREIGLEVKPPQMPSLTVQTPISKDNIETDAAVLLEMKQEIEAKKSRMENLKGRMDGLAGQLEKEFACKSVDEGRTLLDEKKKGIEIKEREFQEGVQVLLEKYPWDFQKGN